MKSVSVVPTQVYPSHGIAKNSRRSSFEKRTRAFLVTWGQARCTPFVFRTRGIADGASRPATASNQGPDALTTTRPETSTSWPESVSRTRTPVTRPPVVTAPVTSA